MRTRSVRHEHLEPDEDEPENELMLLSEIRDLLAERSGAGAAASGGKHTE